MTARGMSRRKIRNLTIFGVLASLLAALALVERVSDPSIGKNPSTGKTVAAANFAHSVNASIVPGTQSDEEQEVSLSGDGTISFTHVTSGFDSVVVRAKGTTCETKKPHLTLYVDDVSYGSKYPAGGSWDDYEYHTKLIEAGAHKIVLEYDNSSSSASCEEPLKVSLLTFPDPRPIAVGNYVAGFPGQWPGTAQTLNNFSTKTGRDPAFVTWYQDWVGDSGFVPQHFALLKGRTTTPMLSWSPSNFSKYGEAVRQPEYSLSKIASGDWDAYVRHTARDMRNYGKPVYLRFAHEMNGDWYPWGIGVNGNRPGDYVAAWRHIHNIFEQEGATNVRWVWSPNTKTDLASYKSLYPGDEHVDWVAIDGYNWRTANRGGWRSFSQVFAPSYGAMTKLTSKPIMIAETASAEDSTGPNGSTRKASWIEDAYLSVLPARFPQVKAVLWFNIDRERDWRVDSSPESLSAYKRVVGKPKYKGTLPP